MYEDIDILVDEINTDQPTIPSKWKWLDDKLDGGFLENGRALYVFAGETNVGKSIFLGNIACNIASQGKTVLLISLEMSEMMYAKRLSSSITNIPMREMRNDSNTLKHRIQQHSINNPNDKIIIKEYPPSTITSQQIQGFIRELHNKGIKPDTIVLDYLNLLKSDIGTNSYERIKYVTEEIRALSYVFNCPIISKSVDTKYSPIW